MGERKSGSVEGIHVSQGFSQEEGEGLRGAGGAVDAQAITHYGFIPPHRRHWRELRSQTPTLPAPRPRNHVPKFPRLIHFTDEYDMFISSTAACLLPPSIECALSAATLEERALLCVTSASSHPCPPVSSVLLGMDHLR
ncbi:hypothetical protein C4D60_Mb08t27980 [Musa balbisiana]|uniref:Uncharacterized protein n=1 Tax=Musa balbisiana TaxID=52838 RepID=A0A4V4H993_MUSBA|nr:hypothetical protein C4D60_Mb08t27980 [Musa balbisiana]